MAKLWKIDNAGPGEFDLCFYCPGCLTAHGVVTVPHEGPGPVWSFNGNFDRPTIKASVLVRGHYSKVNFDGTVTHFEITCHSFVTDGKIQFLSDCTHELAGQTVEMEDF